MEKDGGSVTQDAHFIWDGTQIIEERLSTGEINRFGQDWEQLNGSARYITRDHLGSVREVTDATGTMVTRNDYDPYGRLTRVAGTEDSRFGFGGYYVHGPSGLELTLYPAYDPDLGRWSSQDPIGGAGGANLYGYVENRPVVLADPLGLCGQGPQNDQKNKQQQKSTDKSNGTKTSEKWKAFGECVSLGGGFTASTIFTAAMFAGAAAAGPVGVFVWTEGLESLLTLTIVGPAAAICGAGAASMK